MIENNNWREVFIPEVLFFQEGPGVRNTQFRESGVKLLNVGNINNGVINLSSTKTHLSEEEAFGKYSHFLVDDGDLLIACSGIIVENFHNKIALASSEHLPLCLNTSTMRFKPLNKENLNILFFRYYLQSEYFKSQLVKLITGSAQLNFGPSHIKKIKLPLPPLPQQQKIANILDAADALRQNDKALIAKYDELTQALFLDMFGDPVSNPKGFLLKKLEEFYISKKDGTKCGPFGGALKKEEFVEKGIPVWNMDNISKKGELVPEINLWINEEKYKILSSYSVVNDDIIISRAGTVGKMCVVKTNFEQSIISTNLIRLRLNKSLLLPLYFVLLMTYFKNRISRLQTGAEGAFTHMNTGVLNDIKFPCPPIKLQNQFAERVAAIEEQKAIAQKSLEHSESLFNSLLQKAFKGELY
jgi:type I restriction enzyme S subunit